MKAKKYVTNILRNQKFEESEIEVTEYNNEEKYIINIHPEIEYQEWLGLGGALTNSTIVNMNKLSEVGKNSLLNNYFGELNYNFVRLPIGSTDFSTNSTTDYTEDFRENCDILKDIKQKRNVQIIATPWSPPAKYKTNNSLYGGNLKKECYSDYANYLTNCINDYEFAGIKINYISPQNEPFANQSWESCTYSIPEYKDFLYNFLIPKLKDTKVILWEHNKDNLYNIFNELYEQNSKIAGIGFHWYTGSYCKELELIHQKYPSILLFETEMCCGFSKYNPKKWIIDGELYLSEIISGINSGLNAFIDWNMLLDFYGGPNHKKNNCKSPIILTKKEDDFIKTPIFYYLKHIGIVNKGHVIATSCYERDCSLQVVAVKNEKIYITVVNKSDNNRIINIKLENSLIRDTINKHSVITYEI